MKRQVILSVAILLLILISTIRSQTNALAVLAGSLQSGTFGLLNQDGDMSGYTWNLLLGNYQNACAPGSPSGSIMGYAQKAAYDASTDRIYFEGAAHTSGSGVCKNETIRYDVATNRWTHLGIMPNLSPQGHSYDANVIHPSARLFFTSSLLLDNSVVKMDLNTESYSAMAQPTILPAGEPSDEYFPDRDEVLRVQGTQMAKYNRAANTWSGVGSMSGLAFRSAIARYSPLCQCVIVMGGVDTNYVPAHPSHAVYRYDKNGVISRLADAPLSIWFYISHALAATDPATGHIVVVNAVLTSAGLENYTGQLELWDFDPIAVVWVKLNSAIIPDTSLWWTQKGNPFAVVVAPVSKYGVILFMSARYVSDPSNPNSARAKVYVYKHANNTSLPDTTAPTVPGNLTAVPQSSSQINLSWTASTDNVAVTGYKIARNGTMLANVTGTTFSDANLNPSTSYSYTVAAYDAASNTSANAGPVSAITLPVTDVTPPTDPSGLAASILSQVILSWTAATDNIGVTGYQIERCVGIGCSTFVTVATVTGLTYTDAGLASDTYSYRIRAKDAAGNLSPNPQILTVNIATSTAQGGTIPPSTQTAFAQKCAANGVLACYGFDASSSVRNFPAGAPPYPLKYGDGTGNGVNPLTGACSAFGTNYAFTIARNYGTPPGARELTAFVKVQNGTCYGPVIDNAVAKSGTGSLRIEVPTYSDATNGGYFDSTFSGIDQIPTRVGPDNGGEVWNQFQYRMHNLARNTLNGTFTDIAKILIFGGAPPGLDYFGSDMTLASVFGYAKNHEGIFQSYTRINTGSGIGITERTIGGILYMQTGAKCVYAGAGPYPVPPCIKPVDDQWMQITRHFKLRPVATDFSVSGNTLSRANTFNSGMVGRYVYIVGGGYFKIVTYSSAGSVTLSATPAAGSNKTVFISGYPNSIIQEWVDAKAVTDISDQQMFWDMANAGWGEFRLQAHMTNRNATIAITPGTVWYDDFIVSSQPIAF